MPFGITVVRDGDVATLALAGELDMATAAELEGRIAELIAAGSRHLVIDLHDLTFCDSTGLRTFVRANRHCAADGGWLRLTRARGHVAKVIEISGLAELMAYRAAGAEAPES